MNPSLIPPVPSPADALFPADSGETGQIVKRSAAEEFSAQLERDARRYDRPLQEDMLWIS